MNTQTDTDIISAFEKTIEQELYKGSVDLVNKFCNMFEEEIIKRRNTVVANILDAIEIEAYRCRIPERIEFQINLSSSPAKQGELIRKIQELENEIEDLQEENAELRQACDGNGLPRSNY